MKKILILFISLSCFLINYCSKKPEPILKIGTNFWPGYEPLYLAREKSFFPTDYIKLIEYTSSSEVIQAFKNNIIECAALTLDESFLLLEAGLDIKIILIMDVSNGGDVILAKPSIKSLKELKDKTIGLEASALGGYVLSRALQIGGLELRDIKTKTLEISEHERAFKENELDAIITFEPIKTKLLKFGANEIFSSKQIPNEIIDVLVIKTDYLYSNKEQVEKLLAGWFKALDFLNEQRQLAYKIMCKRENLSPTEFDTALLGLSFPEISKNYFLLNDSSISIKKTTLNLLKVMYENQLLTKKININSLFENSLLEELKK